MQYTNQIISEHISSSPEMTRNIGREIAANIKENQIIAFMGDLGAGKTTLIKGLVSILAKIEEEEISSPTFTYLNIYSGQKEIYHFDLYRIEDKDQFTLMGFDEYFENGGICLIEWSEKITEILPPSTIIIHIINDNENENCRKITVLKP